MAPPELDAISVLSARRSALAVQRAWFRIEGTLQRRRSKRTFPEIPSREKRRSLCVFLRTPARAINQRAGAAGQLSVHRKLARVSAFHPEPTPSAGTKSQILPTRTTRIRSGAARCTSHQRRTGASTTAWHPTIRELGWQGQFGRRGQTRAGMMPKGAKVSTRISALRGPRQQTGPLPTTQRTGTLKVTRLVSTSLC
jgi:hypothetical protein